MESVGVCPDSPVEARCSGGAVIDAAEAFLAICEKNGERDALAVFKLDADGVGRRGSCVGNDRDGAEVVAFASKG